MPWVVSRRGRRAAGSSPSAAAHCCDFLGGDRDGDQVGIGKIAVVARFFLVPLAAGDLVDVVPAAGLFRHVAQLLAGLLPGLELPDGFVFHCPLDGPKAVDVFDFDDRRGHFSVRRVDVQIDIGVDAQASLLHVAIGNAQVGQQQLELGQIGLGFGGRAHVGLADDLQQRRAGPIQIDAAVGLAGQLVVHALAGVFFQVRRMMPIRLGWMRPLGSLISSQPSWLKGRSYWLI